MFLDNIKLIMILYLIYGASFMANTIAGIQLNVKEVGLKFDWKKLWNGLVRATLIAVVLFLLVIVISYVFPVLSNAGIEVSNEVKSSISNLLIVGVLITAIIKYFKDAVTKLVKIFNITEEEIIELKQKENKTIEIPIENEIGADDGD